MGSNDEAFVFSASLWDSEEQTVKVLEAAFLNREEAMVYGIDAAMEIHKDYSETSFVWQDQDGGGIVGIVPGETGEPPEFIITVHPLKLMSVTQ